MYITMVTNCARVFVVLLVGASIAWLPIVQSFSELYMYIQSIQSLLSAPVCAVYALALLWPRTNEQVCMLH